MLRMISNLLDGVYKIGAAVAGVLLVMLCCLVLFSISSRMFGFYAGGATDLAGYVMATSTFLALAYTFRTDGHIRVALLIQNFHGAQRRLVELICLSVTSIVAVFLAFYMYRLVFDSWDFGERSEGADAILIWIPQLPVAIGAALLAISVLHTLIQALFDYDAVNPELSAHDGAPEV